VAGTAVKSVTIYPLSIPLRRPVTHAAARRDMAEPIVVAIELIGGAIGFGETLPRPYVTGEDIDSALAAMQHELAPRLLEFRPASLPEAFEAIDALPWTSTHGASIPAARAAMELALLDAYARHFHRPMHDLAGWLGLPGFGAPGSARTMRYSGVLASEHVGSTMRTLRLLWWYGLRHFKLKVGDPGQSERVSAVVHYLRRPLARGRATLRLDANGAWTAEAALEHLGDWRALPIAAIEQPLPRGAEKALPLLADICDFPLYHDESLVTIDDARRLVELGVAGGFNIRLSKCGGLMPALRLAEFARRNDVAVQLGCMVGETSILSAAGRRFLEMVPGVSFAEGWFGSFLLADDVVDRPLRFGYGGRGRPLAAEGWGITVNTSKLEPRAARTKIRLEY
jgi:muconate cycloisomerase